jgi:hypothetical protein
MEKATFVDIFRHEKHPDYQKKKGKILKKLADIRKESKLLKEIKDIRDEIKMVLAVFDDQSVSLAATKKYFGLSLTNAESLLETSAKDFTAMESHAKTVEDGVSCGVFQHVQRLIIPAPKASRT